MMMVRKLDKQQDQAHQASVVVLAASSGRLLLERVRGGASDAPGIGAACVRTHARLWNTTTVSAHLGIERDRLQPLCCKV